MFKNKIAIPTLVLLFLTAAAVGRSTFGNETYVPASPVKASDTSVFVTGDSVFFDTLSLSLKEIPTVQNMYTMGKKSISKWAKLFIAVKIVESGNDGDNSLYARRDFNLTGMRQPKVRKTLSLGGTKSNYATFASWYDCMLDFGMYLDGMDRSFHRRNHRFTQSEEEMVEFLFKKYNSHPIWRKRVLYVLKNFKLK